MTDEPYHAMGEEPPGCVRGYMCMIDWECEIGLASGGNRIYPSIEDLKKCHPCWESCGIVEVVVCEAREVHPQDLYLNSAEESDAALGT